MLALLTVMLAGLLWLYAAQTGLGHWQVDEFRYFAEHRSIGWSAYFGRLYVSPRPLSELLIYGYGAAVLGSDRDLVGPVLLLVWGGALLATTAAAWSALPRSPLRPLAAVALGLSPLTFALLNAPVTEMFYWPVATVAYVPCVAAVTALLLSLDEAPGRTRRIVCCAALAVSTLSHEIGAAFAIGFGAAVAMFEVRDWRVGASAGWRRAAGQLWWLGPALAGLLVMAALVAFRSHTVDLGSDTKPYTGRLLASAGAAGWQMIRDVVTSGYPAEDMADSIRVCGGKLMFAAGFAAIRLRWGGARPGRLHAAMALGLCVAVFFSLLAAYFHYGDLCCERQASARQWLIELLLIVGATAALARWRAWRRWTRASAVLGPLLLTASLLPSGLLLPAIRADFAFLDLAQHARERTWQSGLGAGPAMEFYMPPSNGDMLIRGTSVPVGSYDIGDTSTDPERQLGVAVGAFFGKQTVNACQAWQTRQSFLIDGRFIPACPPHPGPADIVFDTVPR